MIDMHEHTGNKQALEVALKMADWLTHTPNLSLLTTGSAFCSPSMEHERGIFQPLRHHGERQIQRPGLPIRAQENIRSLAANQDMLAGNHANTNIPKMIGAIRGYELTGDKRYLDIAQNFYRIVKDHHTYCTGGTSNGELWHAPDAIASELGPAAEECCCSYNMMKLTRHLFGQHPMQVTSTTTSAC